MSSTCFRSSSCSRPVKPVPKVGVKTRAKAKPLKVQTPDGTQLPASASLPSNVSAEVVTGKAEDGPVKETTQNESTSVITEKSSTKIMAAGALERESKMDKTTLPASTDSNLDNQSLIEKGDSNTENFTTLTASTAENIKREKTEESENSGLSTVATEELKSTMGTADQAEKEPMKATEHAEKEPMKATEDAEEEPIKATEHAEKEPMKATEHAEKEPVCTTEHSKNEAMDIVDHGEEAPMDITEHVEKVPLNTAEHSEKVSLDTTEHGEKVPIETAEHEERAPVDLTDGAGVASSNNRDLPQVEAASGVEVKGDRLVQDNVAKSLSECETVVVGINDNGENDITAASVDLEMEPKSISTEESCQGNKVTQEDLKTHNTMAENEVQIREHSDMGKRVQTDRTCDQNQLSEKNEPQPMPVPLDDVSLDFPPVTQEILKALEAAVHQCRLQSSLRRAEEEARQKTDAERMEQALPITKKPSPVDDSLQVSKKAVPAVKGKISLSSGSKGQYGDSETPERESSSRHRQKNSPVTRRPTTRRGGSSSSSASRKNRSDCSPVSKGSREQEDEGYKVRVSKCIHFETCTVACSYRHSTRNYH